MNDREAFFFDARRRRFTLRRDFGISEALVAASIAASAGGALAASRMGGGKIPALKPPPPAPDPEKGKIEAQRKAENDALLGRAGTSLVNDRSTNLGPTSLLASVGQPMPYTNRTLGS